jgi:hypothetical protein
MTLSPYRLAAASHVGERHARELHVPCHPGALGSLQNQPSDGQFLQDGSGKCQIFDTQRRMFVTIG